MSASESAAIDVVGFVKEFSNAVDDLRIALLGDKFAAVIAAMMNKTAKFVLHGTSENLLIVVLNGSQDKHIIEKICNQQNILIIARHCEIYHLAVKQNLIIRKSRGYGKRNQTSCWIAWLSRDDYIERIFHPSHTQTQSQMKKYYITQFKQRQYDPRITYVGSIYDIHIYLSTVELRSRDFTFFFTNESVEFFIQRYQEYLRYCESNRIPLYCSAFFATTFCQMYVRPPPPPSIPTVPAASAISAISAAPTVPTVPVVSIVTPPIFAVPPPIAVSADCHQKTTPDRPKLEANDVSATMTIANMKRTPMSDNQDTIITDEQKEVMESSAASSAASPMISMPTKQMAEIMTQLEDLKRQTACLMREKRAASTSDQETVKRQKIGTSENYKTGEIYEMKLCSAIKICTEHGWSIESIDFNGQMYKQKRLKIVFCPMWPRTIYSPGTYRKTNNDQSTFISYLIQLHTKSVKGTNVRMLADKSKFVCCTWEQTDRPGNYNDNFVVYTDNIEAFIDKVIQFDAKYGLYKYINALEIDYTINSTG